jgi:hypothetical protein
MSRPGFVFDLVTTDPGKKRTYTCRSCKQQQDGSQSADHVLHASMKDHLRDSHGLIAQEGWKITHQDRSPGEAIVCFWPPEAL